MSANYSYFEIDVGDIWEYERDQYLLKRTDPLFASDLLNKIQLTLISLGIYSYDISLYDDGSVADKAYYKRNLDEYLEADLEKKYRIEYFFHQDNKCYEYYQNLIIDKNNPDFESYFALKLKQYKEKLSYVKSFLNYQLKKSYNNNRKKFLEFLEIIRDQYEDIFTESLKLQINKFINTHIQKKDSNTKIEEETGYSINLLALHLFYLVKTGKIEDPNIGDKGTKLRDYLNKMQSGKSWKSLSAAYDIVTTGRNRYKLLHTKPDKKLNQDYYTLFLKIPDVDSTMLKELENDYFQAIE